MKKHFECVVVGGGIVGAGLFRDLTLNNVETLLIEKGDFSSQTSERSSKMLHGGIRYLENLDFALVFEALHEKNLWLKLTPHLAREASFYLPIYQDAKRPLWMIKLGLFLYDLLSTFKNSPHQIKNAADTLKGIPILKSNGLSGAGIYYDGIMDDAKITLEVIYDALSENRSMALNHTSLVSINNDSHGPSTLTLLDHLTNTETIITAEQVVYALGPYTDNFLKKFPIYNWNEDVLLPSKGSHLWFSKKDLPLNYPIVMTPHDENGDRVIFVIPHEEKILVGTTEVPVDDQDAFELTVSEKEINYLLKNLNEYFPSLSLKKTHIIGQFAGIRPLAKSANTNERGKTSREHRIFQPTSNTHVIVGGKYTTFRTMAQEITRLVCHHFNRPYNVDKSLSSLRQKSIVLPFSWHLPNAAELEKICQTEYPKTFSDLILRRLSIPSRKNWEEKTQIDFDQYFLEHLPMLKKYLQISEVDIKKF